MKSSNKTCLILVISFCCQCSNASINLIDNDVFRNRVKVHLARSSSVTSISQRSQPINAIEVRRYENQGSNDEEAINDKRRKNKFWPPWPFNLLSDRTSLAEVPKISLLGEYLRQRIIFCMCGVQTVASEASLHLPPAAPALILLAAVPNAKLTRKLTYTTLAVALMSWGQDELSRVRATRKSLIECNLYHENQVIFLPFLPEDDENQESSEQTLLSGNEQVLEKRRASAWIALQNKFNDKFIQLKRKRAVLHRERIMHELYALKELKKPELQRNSFALVTGASRGLGRAIAVELARRQINLILVARDLERLNNVAADLKNFYGVQCHVLQADLSEEDAPERIFNATTRYGLNVDIFINNAGLSTTEEFVDEDLDYLDKVVNVNVVSTVKLSHLYLKKMRERRKGAMLLVSSITGHVPTCPMATVYAATKAFERSFTYGLSLENEKHGIAITLLSPGAISDTAFAKRGNFEDALCWKVPFYPRSPEFVAKAGIDALAEGKLECIPGWQNRFGLRILQPLIPKKVMMNICQMAWQPLKRSLPTWLGGQVQVYEQVEVEHLDSSAEKIHELNLEFDKIPLFLELHPKAAQTMPQNETMVSEDIVLDSDASQNRTIKDSALIFNEEIMLKTEREEQLEEQTAPEEN